MCPLSLSLQTALSSFFQEANIPSHHHQMVSSPQNNDMRVKGVSVGFIRSGICLIKQEQHPAPA